MVMVAGVGIGACKGLSAGVAVGVGIAEAGLAGEADFAAIADTKLAGTGKTAVGSADVAVTDVGATIPVDVCEAGSGGIEDCAGGTKGRVGFVRNEGAASATAWRAASDASGDVGCASLETRKFTGALATSEGAERTSKPLLKFDTETVSAELVTASGTAEAAEIVALRLG